MLQITERATTHLVRARTEGGFDEHAGRASCAALPASG
jgi:hypothetical protein